jgi:hypothetical protein
MSPPDQASKPINVVVNNSTSGLTGSGKTIDVEIAWFDF